MYAKECSREDVHPLMLDDEGIRRTIEDWQPCLTVYRGKAPDEEPDLWQEVYATWGDAMRDAEKKWAMFTERLKDAVRSGHRGTFFELRKGINGPAVRNWSKDYIPIEVTMPRNNVGICKMRESMDDYRKTICYTLIPYPESGVDYLTAIGMVMDEHGLGHKDPLSTRSRHIRFNNILYNCASGETYVMKGEDTELFDYDGFMPIQNIRHVLRFLPSISYRNDWTSGEMVFIDDEELDRALEANKDWLAYMNVRVARLKDAMRARPDVFEGSYLGNDGTQERTC